MRYLADGNNTQKNTGDICRAKSKLKNCEEKNNIKETLTMSQGKLYAESRAIVKKKMFTSTWT